MPTTCDLKKYLMALETTASGKGAKKGECKERRHSYHTWYKIQRGRTVASKDSKVETLSRVKAQGREHERKEKGGAKKHGRKFLSKE